MTEVIHSPPEASEATDDAHRYVRQLRRVALGVVAALGVVGAVASDDLRSLVIVFGAMGVSGLAIAPFWRHGYRIEEPITAVALLVMFGVLVRLVAITRIGYDDPDIANRILVGRTPQVVISGLLALALGLAALVAGYGVTIRPTDLSRFAVFRRTRWNEQALVLTASAVLGAALLGFLLLVTLTGGGLGDLASLSAKRFNDLDSGSSGRILTPEYWTLRLAGLARVSTLMTIGYLVHRRGSATLAVRVLAMVSVLLALLVAVYVNNRAGIVLLLLDIGAISYLLGGRLRIRRMAVAAGFGLLLMVSLLSLRSTGEITRPVENFERTIIGRDTLDATKTGQILQISDAAPLRGETLVGWAFAPVPQSVLPFEKPQWTGLGNFVFTEAYGGTSDIVGIPAGFVGELFLNLWWPGIAIGMFAFGLTLRWFHRSFAPHLHTLNAAMVYALVLTRFPIFVLGNDLGTGVTKTALELIPLLVCLWLSSRYEQRTATAATD